MSEQSVPTPPPPPAQPPSGGAPRKRKWYQMKRVLLPVVGLVGLFFGMALGGDGDDPAADSSDMSGLEERNAELEAQVAELEEEMAAAGEPEAADETEPPGNGLGQDPAEAAEELAAREAALAEAEAALAEREAALAEAEAEPEPEVTAAPTGEPTEADPPAGGDLRSATYEAGQFAITDVQVGEDFGGSFELVTRATNMGDAVEGAGLAATLFAGGQVVGTLQGNVPPVDSGQTVTVEFFSTDPFVEHDAVEFQFEFGF